MTSSRKKAVLFWLLGTFMGYSLFLTVSLLSKDQAALPAAEAFAARDENPQSALHEALAVQEAFREVAGRVLPTVVEVTVEREGVIPADSEEGVPWDKFFYNPDAEDENPQCYQSQGLGSGFIVHRQENRYFAVTNAHVVGIDGEIQIRLNSGTRLSAVLTGSDIRRDLALLEFESDEILPILPVGDSDELYVGDFVLAFGSPYGYEQSMSSGIVSALGRRDGPGENISDFIQTDAAVNRGNSGGPLVNIRGELVGINTFITTPNSGSIGLGFAVPSNNVRGAVRQLLDYGEVRYGWLGASLGSYGPEAAESLGYEPGGGVMVYQVFQDSPAKEAGLKPGDLITHIDGIRFTDNGNLTYYLGDLFPGTTAEISVDRLGRPLTLQVRIGERADDEAIRRLHPLAFPGFTAAPLTEDLRETMNVDEKIGGVPVAEVYPKTMAQTLGLRPGDLVTAVGDIPVGSLKDLYAALSSRDFTAVTILRDGDVLELNMSIGEMNHE